MKKTSEEKNFLFDIDTEEISLVRRGANRKKIFLIKEENGGSNMTDISNEDLNEVAEILKNDLSKEEEAAFEEIEKQKKLSDKAKVAIKGAMRLLSAHKEEVGGDMMKKLASMAGYGFAPPKKEEPKKPENEEGKKFPFKKEYVHVRKSLLSIVGEKRDEVAKVLKDLEVEDAPSSDDPEMVQLWKENKETKDLLKKERDERVLKEKVDEAKGFEHLTTTPEKLGKIFKAVDEGSIEEADGKELLEVLKSANTQLGENQSMLGELGSSIPGKSSNAEDKIQKEADKLREKDTKLTKEQAYTRVIKEKPELYAELEKEKRGGK